jgi:hypothetical protein
MSPDPFLCWTWINGVLQKVTRARAMSYNLESAMHDPARLLISCGAATEIVRTMSRATPRLAPGVRERFNLIPVSYLQHYGVEGLYERVNNRTVAAILAEFDPADELNLIESGEVEGVRYKLYEAPNADTENGSAGAP